MTYYTLPKNMNIVHINPMLSNTSCNPHISYSFLNYYFQMKLQILEMFNNVDLLENRFEDAIRIINPYEFVFSKVPGSKYSVSKLKTNSNLFYDLFEIATTFHLLEEYKQTPIKSLHISYNYQDSIDCCEMIREQCIDEYFSLNVIDTNVEPLGDNKFEYIFYETNVDSQDEYIVSFVTIIIYILKCQAQNGNIVIKIKDIIYKPILDCLYLLTSFYDKVCIAKPNTSNIACSDKYVVCKSFQLDKFTINYVKLQCIKLIVMLKKMENKHIVNILGTDIPYYFKNKIDDINIIFGQQQIESLDQIVSIYKNKHKNDKIENAKKYNIQKSVSWCEKYNIPCNKFAEKINIFLPIVNET